MRYAAPIKASSEYVLVNDYQYHEFKFPQSDKFTEIDFGPVELNAGLAIDYFKLEQIFD